MLQWIIDLAHGLSWLLALGGIGAVAVVIAIYVPKPFRPWAWGALAVIGSIIIGNMLWGEIKASIRAEERAACDADYKAAQAEADAEARERQSRIKKDAQKRKAEIYEKDNDRPVGPLLNDYFNGLR